MRLTETLEDVGKALAFYPSLAKCLGGVNRAVFVCEFIYWKGKEADPDGWIYKTHADIEDETGLTDDEQNSARKALKSLGILEEKIKGLPAKLYYRINTDALNEQWENRETLTAERLSANRQRTAKARQTRSSNRKQAECESDGKDSDLQNAKDSDLQNASNEHSITHSNTQANTNHAPDGATDEPAQQKMVCAECQSEDVKACGPDVGRCGKCKGNKLGFVGLKTAPAKPSEKASTSDSEQTLALSDWFTYNGESGCLSSARKLRKIYGDEAIQSALAQVKGKRVKSPYGYFCKVADGMVTGETSEPEPSTYEAILAKCRREYSTQPDSIISYMAGQEFQRLQAAL